MKRNLNPIQKFFYGIRSLIFYILYLPSLVFFASLGFSIGLVIPYKHRQNLVSFGAATTDFWLRVFMGVKIKVEGEENMIEGPLVVLAKHQSTWETYHLQRRFRPVSTILKKELLSIPFFGWGLSRLHPIGIDRSNPRQAMKQIMEQGKKRLAEGNNIVIYPEGTRVEVGKPGKYARSGAALAIEAGVPVIPVAHNAGICWPGKRFLLFPGTINLVIGKPIDPTGMTSKQLTDQVRDWIETQQARIEK